MYSIVYIQQIISNNYIYIEIIYIYIYTYIYIYPAIYLPT